MSRAWKSGGSAYRSRVLVGGSVVSILPTWSDGAGVRDRASAASRNDIVVQDGEWHFADAASAPEATHRNYVEICAILGI
jgi:hypothetical protein